MLLLTTILWLILVVLLCHQITRLVAESTSGLVFRATIFPGVLVHELSHWLMCILTRAPVKRVQLFGRIPTTEAGQPDLTKDSQSAKHHPPQWGGYVLHGPSKLPVIGDSLIAFAPLFGGLAVLALTTSLMNDPLGLAESPAEAAGAQANWFGQLRQLMWGVLCVIGRLPSRIFSHGSSVLFWLYLYLTISVAVSLAPSRQDFSNSLRSVWQNIFKIAIVLVLLGGLVWLAGGILASVSEEMLPWLTGVFAFTLSILIVTLIITWLVTRLTNLFRRRKPTTPATA